MYWKHYSECVNTKEEGISNVSINMIRVISYQYLTSPVCDDGPNEAKEV